MALEDDTNVGVAAELIKRIYRSWRFSDVKITVADATALALHDAGLLSDAEVEVDLEITVDRLVRKYRPWLVD